MPDILTTTAQAAGLTDPDLLKLARPGLTPDAAVKDLRGRFPAAFGQPLDVRTCSEAEYAEARQRVCYPWRGDRP